MERENCPCLILGKPDENGCIVDICNLDNMEEDGDMCLEFPGVCPKLMTLDQDSQGEIAGRFKREYVQVALDYYRSLK